MPTLLGPEFTNSFDGFPARMSPEDFAIWQRWWPTVRKGTLRLFFDVGLGPGKNLPDDASAEMAFMWLRNTQKRADVIIERESDVWIVELRFAAQSSAIGRLKTYELLWNKDRKIDKPLLLYLVTNSRDLDVQQTAESMRIIYIVV